MYRSIGGPHMDDDYDKEMTEKMSKEEKKTFKTYTNKCRAEDDMKTLIRAKEIRDDEERKSMALACAKMEAKTINSITKEGE